ncbi:hypothetical protein [Aestuariibius sp. HNIBRBA575]|uniref:hypothetical protein n=1 Tax=Aestuariibius sp. HNIBRBA575 TaxID=3233343 RepID=UPI0034A2EBE2
MTIKTWVTSVTFVLVGWITLQLGVMYFSDAAPGAMVLFPDHDFISRLPAQTAIVDMGGFWITLASDEPNLGKNLYSAGALIVLPAGLPGCVPLG